MKYIPHRKCIACQSIRPKHELVRIAKLPDGTYLLDLEHQLDGRGAYVCNKQECIEQAMKKNALHRSFKTKVLDECYEELKKFQEESFHAR
ncbi:MAG: YlxR family protein [Clostridia bacterium]|nr:YlxR family protein [Clostridia bacterium]